MVSVRESDVYSVNSYNEYGDTNAHWSMQKGDFLPFGQLGGSINFDVIDEINKFHSAIIEKGAVLYMSYPGFQAKSFDNSYNQIKNIENILVNMGITVLGNPERYKLPDGMMFDSAYHLNKKGVDYRTNLLIEDIKKVEIP